MTGRQSSSFEDREQFVQKAVADEQANEQRVRDGFWPKFLKVAGHIPFAEDLAAVWYCAKDPQTPFRVRAVLLAALAYFVVPSDVIPDFVVGLGFTDDALVLSTALTLVANYVKPHHRRAAQRSLGKAVEENPEAL